MITRPIGVASLAILFCEIQVSATPEMDSPLLNAAYRIPPLWQFCMLGFLVFLLCHYMIIYRERRRLRSSCTNMTALLGISELDYFILDTRGNFLLRPRNDRCWKFVHGKPVPPEEWIIPEDVGNYKAKLEQLLSGKSFYISMIYRVAAPEGRRYFSLRAMPVISANKTDRCFVGTIHEITSARRNEQRYHDTMILLQNIMDSIPCPVFTKDIDDDLRYLTCNKVFADQFAIPVSRIVGKTDYEICRKEEDSQLLRAHDEVVVSAGGRLFNIHESYTTADDNIYSCHSMKKVLSLSNGKRVLLGVSIDTTKEEMAKQQLAESEKKLREANIIMQSILDNAPCAIWLKDMSADGTYLLANRGFHKLMHTVPEKVIGHRASDFLSEEISAVINANDQQVMNGIGEIFTFDRNYLLDGHNYHAHILELRMSQEKGQQLLLGIAIDLTRLIETQKELEIALEKANTANKTRSYFFASVSHELRTPLNAVIGFSELMQNQNLTKAEQLENLKAINYAGNTLLNLINDLLDLSKLEAEQMPLIPTSVDLRKICGEIAASFKPRCTENKIRLHLDIPEDFPEYLLLDDLRLRQIFFNLLGNAVKFTHDGSIEMRLSFLPSGRNRGMLRFRIADTGSGIPESDQTKIFEPFMQSMHHIPGNRSYQGTGLGLPIVKKMVERMNGTISVASKPGEGSVFTVDLPDISISEDMALKEEECRSDNAEGCISARSFCRKIMLVDDVPMNLTVLSAMLKKLGIPEIIVCSTGAEVLEKAPQVQPDLILADLWMPEMKGDEMAEHLKKDPKTAEIPVVVITADTQLHDMDVFCGTLLKPITLKKLNEMLQEIAVKSKISG